MLPRIEEKFVAARKSLELSTITKKGWHEKKEKKKKKKNWQKTITFVYIQKNYLTRHTFFRNQSAERFSPNMHP